MCEYFGFIFYFHHYSKDLFGEKEYKTDKETK